MSIRSGSSLVTDGRLTIRSKKRHSRRRNKMKKMLLVVLMLLIAGNAYAWMSKKNVECNVKGKTQRVKTVDACKALGGKVVEAKKK